MQDKKYSRTALRVAMRRAAHQLLDRPLILDDPYAFRILPPEAAAEVRADPAQGQRSFGTALRLFMAVRSRFAEDEFAKAVAGGVRQYVALGAGLDTFAWRNPHAAAGIRVFEVDHPATQMWKRELMTQAGLAAPPGTSYAPIDFERESLAEGLLRAGFQEDSPAFFSWLGVVPYLTLEAFRETLRFFGGMAAGSGVVFDYPLPREAVDEASRGAFDELSARVASIGEPFRLAFLPEGLAEEFRRIGWSAVNELDTAGIRKRFNQDSRNSESRSGVARLAHYGNLACQKCPPEFTASLFPERFCLP